MRADDPVGDERASLTEALLLIRLYRELAAPKPPMDPLALVCPHGPASTSTVSRLYALQLSRDMRAFLAQPKRCRRGLHEMTPDNTYHGKRGDQCRACRNDSRRKLTLVA